MLNRMYFTMFAGVLLVSGCTHSRPPLDISSEAFTTKITDSGIKLFVYQLDMEMPADQYRKSGGRPSSGGQGGKGGKDGKGGGPPMRGGRGGEDEDDSDEELDLMLANKLKENGFCRNGYIKLDRHQVNKGSIAIRGECEEGATAADRKAFPNS